MLLVSVSYFSEVITNSLQIEIRGQNLILRLKQVRKALDKLLVIRKDHVSEENILLKEVVIEEHLHFVVHDSLE